MRCLRTTLLCTSILAVACGGPVDGADGEDGADGADGDSDTTDGDDPIDLGGLEGGFDLSAGEVDSDGAAPCLLDIDGGVASADCSQTFSDGEGGLAVDVVVENDMISGTLDYMVDRVPQDDPCRVSYTTEISAMGQATKDSSIAMEGVFSAIGGVWTGSIDVHHQKSNQYIIDAPAECYDATNDVNTYTFSAWFAGDVAQIDWTRDDGESGTLDVEAVDGEILVNGEVIMR